MAATFTYYITFGQSHAHRIGGRLVDKDTVVAIEAKDENTARNLAFALFGDKWAFLYTELPEMQWFPGGLWEFDDELLTEAINARQSNRAHKAYLGDAVYANWDGYHVVLTTEDGISTTNTIHLEPAVCEALAGYIRNLNERTRG